MDRGSVVKPNPNKGKTTYMLAPRQGTSMLWEGSRRQILRRLYGSSLCSGPDLACGSGNGHLTEHSLVHSPPLVTGSYNLTRPLFRNAP